CTAQMEAAARVSSTKSRSETPSSELSVGLSKPSALAVACRSMGNDVPASAAEPSARIRQPAAVATEHFCVSQQMMAESDGLCRLQVREPRHDGAGVRFRL